jgi:TRAP-type C4-dicarboxylate transport system permease small subunit
VAQFDRAVYRAERVLAAALFLAMSLVMFVNVVQRVYSREESRLVSIFLDKPPTPENAWWHHTFSMWLSLALAFVLAYLGARTITLKRPLGRLASVGAALAVTALLGGVVKLVLAMFPNGVIWAPRFCGVGMLWVGLLGASMATYEKRHLALEMGDKLWPKKVFPYVKAVSLLTATVMCVFLVWLAWLSISDYRSHNDVIDPSSFRWAKWKVLLVVPYALGMMAFRFAYQAGRVVAHPEEAHTAELLPVVPTGASEDGQEPPR